MLRHACTLAGQLKELLLTFIDSLDGTKRQQCGVEEVEQSCLSHYQTHLGQRLGLRIGDDP
jgi:hypothetical protein